MPRAVQDGNPAAMLPAEEAEQEPGHAPLIDPAGANLKPGRVTYTEAHRVSPIFRRHGHRTRSTLPSAGVLRRERRGLLRFREERLRDLGGLLLEMFRRDRFREDLVRERCEELLEIDDHLAGLDALLGITWTLPEPARCACGAALAQEDSFCGACGRSVGEAARRCAACGNALAGDAAFCARCGMRTDARAVHQADSPPELEQHPAEVAES